MLPLPKQALTEFLVNNESLQKEREVVCSSSPLMGILALLNIHRSDIATIKTNFTFAMVRK
jgi:hypothetical protein